MAVKETRTLTDVSGYAAKAETLLGMVASDASPPNDPAITAGLRIATVYALLAVAEQLAISNGLPPTKEPD